MGKVIMSGCAKNATIPSFISTFKVGPSDHMGSIGIFSYNFKVGMTWEEFANSKYNVGDKKVIVVSNTSEVFFDSYGGLVLLDQYDSSKANIIQKTDVIIKNYEYYYSV